MSETNVISINPGVKTPGELHINDSALADITRRLSAPVRKTVSPFKSIVNFMLGINAKVNAQFSGKMMLMRLVCGSLMLVLAFYGYNGSDFSVLGLTEPTVLLITGISLILGIFTRMATLAGAAWYGMAVYTGISAGAAPEFFEAAMAMILVVFSVFGPGRYCVDQFIRRGLYRLAKSFRRRKRKNASGIAFDYRAYNMADRRIG